MKDYHIIISVTNGGGQLNHKPLVQYWRLRYAIGHNTIKRITLTMPRIESDGTFHVSAPIDMNIEAFYNGYGFSNADIKRWLQLKHWTRTGTLLLFKVSLAKKMLNYTLVGKVDTKF